ncbi:MAG: arginine deiminase-related protein, partial [Alphaproteobacteria bacterium]
MAFQLTVRHEEGGTPVSSEWGANCEYGVLRDVLLGPPETFRAVDNAQFSSVVRATERHAKALDTQLAMRQHREMVAAYEDAGVTVHFLPQDEETGYQVYARDSSFMTPYGAVVCQMANPRRRGEYASVLRFYLDRGVPIYDLVSAGGFEGGDFNMIEPGSVLIGYTDARSEGVAARQIGRWIEREGWEVKYAPIDSFYVHIDLMVCMLAERLAAVCLDTTEPEIVDWLKSKNIELVPVSFQ